jgi:hypothetical protein
VAAPPAPIYAGNNAYFEANPRLVTPKDFDDSPYFEDVAALLRK